MCSLFVSSLTPLCLCFVLLCSKVDFDKRLAEHSLMSCLRGARAGQNTAPTCPCTPPQPWHTKPFPQPLSCTPDNPPHADCHCLCPPTLLPLYPLHLRIPCWPPTPVLFQIGPGVSLGRILGVPSIEPFFGGGGGVRPEGSINAPPPPRRSESLPAPGSLWLWAVQRVTASTLLCFALPASLSLAL